LFLLLQQLTDLRHHFMHKTVPEEVDVSIAAMCMVGLLKYIERHHGAKTTDILDQSPPIEAQVVAAIRATRLDEYQKFVELFLREKYTNQSLPECPLCGAAAVVSSECEACFEDLDKMECAECGKTIYFFQAGFTDVEVQCAACGHREIL
jgi:DNA-directed RNA polymerase subunit RPC12/RpoP